MSNNVVPVPADELSVDEQLRAERPVMPSNEQNVIIKSNVSLRDILNAGFVLASST